MNRGEASIALLVGAVVFAALVASVPGSPIQPVLPDGAGPIAALRALARGVGLRSLAPLALAVVAIVSTVCVTVAFLFALLQTWRGRVSVRAVYWVGGAFIALAVALPLLFSRDVYSYAIYGRISGVHGANPYVSVPFDFRSDPFFHLVGPQWRGTTAVYGPAFIALSAGLTRWLESGPALILAYKVIAGGAAVGAMLLVGSLARRLWPERAAFAVALVAWNPVVLFHGVGGGHNDMLIALAVIGALVLLLPPAKAGPEGVSAGEGPGAGREMGATALLALAALVKATAVVPLALLLVFVVWRRRGGRRRAQAALAHGGLCLAVGAAFATPFFQLHDPTFGLAELSSHEGWLAPSRFFRVILGAFGEALGGDLGGAVVRTIVRVAFPLMFAVAFWFIARAVMRRAHQLDVRGNAAAWGWALLIATLTAPVLLPWYVVWTVPVAWLLPTRARVATVVLTGLLAVSQTVAAAVEFPVIFHGTLLVGHYVLTPALFLLLAALLLDLRRRVVAGVELEAERVGAVAADPESRQVSANAGSR